MCKHTDSCEHRSRAAPAVRSVTVSSRPGRGLWLDTVQLAVSLPYLPDGLAWPRVTLARSVCLFSTVSLAHLLCLPVCTDTQIHFLPQGHVNRKGATHITKGLLRCHDSAGLTKISMLQQCDIRTLLGSTFPLMSVLYNM